MGRKCVLLTAFLLGFSLFSLESQNSETTFIKQISITDPNYTFYVEKDQGYYKFMRKSTLGVMEQICSYGSRFYPFTVKEKSCDDEYVFHSLDHNEPLFLAETNFFSNYFSSNLKEQLEEKRLPKTTAFIVDINKDNDDEFIEFTYPHTGSNPSGLSIYKYINGEWKEVFCECYFGWEHFYSDENYKKEEWYQPKPFPYDFVEYKGKVGLRIVCYDRPREWPSHYHAQFWAYDEEAQEYKMLEEVWESIERTPADGLVFAEAPDFMSVTEPKFSLLGSKLTATDLEGMDKDQLRLMRNAVYARHGRTFKSKDLQSLFNGYVWYRPNSKYSDDLLTETDRANISLIQEFENR